MEEILDAAAILFAEQGFSASDTQSLADRLQIGKGTLYRYFPSKRELFLAAVDRGMRRLTAEVDGSIEAIDDPLERMAHAIQAYLAFFDRHPHFAELLIQERAHFKDRKKPTYFEHQDANVGRWREMFEQLIKHGRVRAIPADRITSVLSDLVYGTMFTNYFTGRRRSLEYQARDILDVVLLGILTDSERRRVAGRA